MLVPIGAVEQHGPHLPVGTDTWIATEIAERVAAGRSRVLVAEPIPVGASGHHLSFAGTLSLRPSTLVSVLVDLAASIAAHGDTPVFLNGHGGNRPALSLALQELLLEGVRAWSLSYFDELADVLAEVFPDASRAAGHACAMETSILSHLWPEAVSAETVPAAGGQAVWPDPSLFPDAHPQTNRPFEELNPVGVVGQPGLYHPEAGRRLVSAAVSRVGAAVDQILAQCGSASPAED